MIKFTEFHGYQKKVPKQPEKKTMKKKQTQNRWEKLIIEYITTYFTL
jgi:hypothetical protein